MKTTRKLAAISLFLVFAAAIHHPGFAQEQPKDQGVTKKETILQDLDTPNFTFIAQSVNPTSGRIRQLTSTYDLRVTKDTLISNLPYFGRAYSAPINPAEGGFNFTSTDFEYSVKEGKKGSRNILIKPKDVRDPRQMTLNVFENGSASLQVISNNRQPISFNGYVQKRDQ